MSKPSTNFPKEERKREKARTNILAGKGGGRMAQPINASAPQTAQASGGQPRVRSTLLNSDNVRVGIAMRGARKQLGIKRKKA